MQPKDIKVGQRWRYRAIGGAVMRLFERSFNSNVGCTTFRGLTEPDGNPVYLTIHELVKHWEPCDVQG